MLFAKAAPQLTRSMKQTNFEGSRGHPNFRVSWRD
jgi:hypothetical protein